ncbi:hypothetical protein PEC301937_25900 [Pectobacterium carotovorum subsp. carotovorum]|uniref:hypothetical protein n=1 Tax=Pectobacterium actinidiae TaxID=1507808 RepID=UPI002A809CBE|nr:hypothetical protein [Pectobacterium actinidiae]MDY4316443.1 hypothetical protein [Pectobacterium actinidiae]GKW16641.1 hypothetical protein PEC301937_25900 [Pectobacterium carotovorum subsp. carotovorum]
MSKRSDIEQNKLIYTEKIGWVDLGHAKGDDARKLMIAINAGDTKEGNDFIIQYMQSMVYNSKYGTSRITKWKVKKGLSSNDKKRVALTIMMYTSHLFESHQDSALFNWYTDSGYSGEDLVSNLLGFYQAVDGINYLPQLEIADKVDALKRWDYYGPIGKYKNREFRPLLFPHPEKYPNNARPYHAPLPSFMRTILPISEIGEGKTLNKVDEKTGYILGVENRVKIQIQ